MNTLFVSEKQHLKKIEYYFHLQLWGLWLWLQLLQQFQTYLWVFGKKHKISFYFSKHDEYFQTVPVPIPLGNETSIHFIIYQTELLAFQNHKHKHILNKHIQKKKKRQNHTAACPVKRVQSTGLTAANKTFTKTWFASGSGTGISSCLRT